MTAAPARSTPGYRVGNGGGQFLPAHTCPGSGPPARPPASLRPDLTPSWVRCSAFGPSLPQGAPLAGGQSDGSLFFAHQNPFQSLMSSLIAAPFACTETAIRRPFVSL